MRISDWSSDVCSSDLVFDTPVEGMDPMVRRAAKAINFGIIYGMSAFGLAAQLGIPQREAQAYIEAYFKRYPGIRDYMDRTRKQVKEHGFVTRSEEHTSEIQSLMRISYAVFCLTK